MPSDPYCPTHPLTFLYPFLALCSFLSDHCSHWPYHFYYWPPNLSLIVSRLPQLPSPLQYSISSTFPHPCLSPSFPVLLGLLYSYSYFFSKSGPYLLFFASVSSVFICSQLMSSPAFNLLHYRILCLLSLLFSSAGSYLGWHIRSRPRYRNHTLPLPTSVTYFPPRLPHFPLPRPAPFFILPFFLSEPSIPLPQFLISLIAINSNYSVSCLSFSYPLIITAALSLNFFPFRYLLASSATCYTRLPIHHSLLQLYPFYCSFSLYLRSFLFFPTILSLIPLHHAHFPFPLL